MNGILCSAGCAGAGPPERRARVFHMEGDQGRDKRANLGTEGPHLQTLSIQYYPVPVVPHKAVAEVSKIGNL